MAMGLNYARMSGLRFKNPRTVFKRLSGLDPGAMELVDPVQVEAKLAGATGQADEGAETSGGGKRDKPAKKKRGVKPVTPAEGAA